ncbi:MAG TPA: energy-coupling factor ABC transporter permease [Spirochaetota bacterium]|nr:energy-coupling factor ABC transporter permease [Spirochaetota bacterium]HOL55928.1 energy-coupling factor ABC transporter permease [Spirochaetota bacterium]HPP03234.1 energy-coupling factor ABC transporter permease [Spirochaetota bacterium]
MHIPDHMLNGNTVPSITSIISSAGIVAASYFALKSKEKPDSLKFAAVTALIFAMQMLNFPIQNGTSGHFLGTTFAILLLGAPFGILSMSIILLIQTLVFSDGGISVLGANILNMAFGGAIPGILLLSFIKKHENNILLKNILIFFASFLSLLIAAFFCVLELSFSNTIDFSLVFPAMMGVHTLIGICEGLITIILATLLSTSTIKKSENLSFVIPFVGAIIIGLILSPFASSFPDGLEWVAEKYNFLHNNAPYFVSPFKDYTVPFIKNEIFSTSIAGLVGVIITFIFVFTIGKIFSLKKEN